MVNHARITVIQGYIITVNHPKFDACYHWSLIIISHHQNNMLSVEVSPAISQPYWENRPVARCLPYKNHGCDSHSKWYGQLRQSNSGTYKHPTCFRSCFHILIYVVHCWDNNPTGVLYHASSLATHTTSYQMDEMCWSPITFMFRCLVHFIIKTAKPLQNHVIYKL